MSQLSKHMQEAIDAIRVMAPDQQDLLAVELLDRAKALTRSPTKLSPSERAELEAELAAAKRGELATDAEVAAMYARHGL
jgi:hypothetical protein